MYDIKRLLPSHYIEQYPLFVAFFQYYYDWLYRYGGYTYDELNRLIIEQNWLQTNIDKFIYLGNKQYATIDKPRDIEFTLIELQNTRASGTVAQRLHSEYLLERKYSFLETSQEEHFITADEVEFDTPIRNDLFVKNWFDMQGMPWQPQGYDLEAIDNILLTRLLKSIWDIKGTAQAARLFFMIYFKEDIAENNSGSVWIIPKQSIGVIDDNLILDNTQVIRDDEYYNEYSYVIKTKYDYSYYKDLFENIYLKYLHPSGFKVFLEQV